MTGGFTSGRAGRFLQNQALAGRNLRNEQGERNAASELCTAKQVEMFHYLLTLAGEVLSSPPTSGSTLAALAAQPSISLSDGISS
jgi:hypothetical protein